MNIYYPCDICHFLDSSARLDKHASLEPFYYSSSGRTRPHGVGMRFAARLPCPSWAVTLVTLHLTHAWPHHATVCIDVKSGALGYETQRENAASHKVPGNKHVLRTA
jgi:hypothetical protein